MLTDSIKRQIPNALTVLRIALAPAVLVALVMGQNKLALIAFVLAALSDWLDGVLARLWKVQSLFGAALDHTADKILVLSALVAFAVTGELTGWNLILALVLLYREFYVSSLREALAGKGAGLPVSMIGKSKTALQMLALALLIGLPQWSMLGIGLLWLSAAVSLWSAWHYTRGALANI